MNAEINIHTYNIHIYDTIIFQNYNIRRLLYRHAYALYYVNNKSFKRIRIFFFSVKFIILEEG